MRQLSDGQQNIYVFLIEYFNENKWMPSLDEIAYEFGITKAAVSCFIRAIEKKGYIELGHGARTIRITNKDYRIPA